MLLSVAINSHLSEKYSASRQTVSWPVEIIELVKNLGQVILEASWVLHFQDTMEVVSSQYSIIGKSKPSQSLLYSTTSLYNDLPHVLHR